MNGDVNLIIFRYLFKALFKILHIFHKQWSWKCKIFLLIFTVVYDMNHYFVFEIYLTKILKESSWVWCCIRHINFSIGRIFSWKCVVLIIANTLRSWIVTVLLVITLCCSFIRKGSYILVLSLLSISLYGWLRWLILFTQFTQAVRSNLLNWILLHWILGLNWLLNI